MGRLDVDPDRQRAGYRQQRQPLGVREVELQLIAAPAAACPPGLRDLDCRRRDPQIGRRAPAARRGGPVRGDALVWVVQRDDPDVHIALYRARSCGEPTNPHAILASMASTAPERSERRRRRSRRSRDDGREPIAREAWTRLAACTAAAALLQLDGTVITVALPTVARDLHVSNSSTALILSAYFAAYALTLFPGGRLVDRLGARWVALLGLASSRSARRLARSSRASACCAPPACCRASVPASSALPRWPGRSAASRPSGAAPRSVSGARAPAWRT